jgi:hypothetical protein
MSIQIYFKIAGWVDLAVLMIFTPYLISVFINGFELFPLKVMSDDPADQPSWLPCL